MPNTIDAVSQEGMAAELEELAKLDWSMSPAIPEIIQAILAARAYNDSSLMQSHLNGLLEAGQSLVRDAIEKQLGKARFAKHCWQKLQETLKKSPFENFDKVGRQLESLFTKLLESHINFRDGPIRLLETAGYEVENAERLRREIDDLVSLKEHIFRDWPWSSQPLPPVDRQMVAESRAAIARKEGEDIQDLIRRLGGAPTQFS